MPTLPVALIAASREVTGVQAVLAEILGGQVCLTLAFVLCCSLSAQVREARAVQSAGLMPGSWIACMRNLLPEREKR